MEMKRELFDLHREKLQQLNQNSPDELLAFDCEMTLHEAKGFYPEKDSYQKFRQSPKWILEVSFKDIV
ncbi:MAG: hypothetical protein BGO43_09460 [Gammaproteobacteria bacterium 39-13]|nr:hypothetical protein [Gammaproteobacteria bacterium]OJV93869.1 MAG: hypothetical protein BGO43_09460 [Gammaproteobacteria bacterium 39-13]